MKSNAEFPALLNRDFIQSGISEATRIVFIGDSITDAFRKPEEINPAFQLGNGFVFLIASRLAAETPPGPHCFNRGCSGDGIKEIAVRWERDVLALKPDIVSLLVGINETIRCFIGEPSVEAAEFEECYRQLLLQSRIANPDVHLILIEPFLLPTGIVKNGWGQHLEPLQAAVRQLAEESNATFIPTQSVFNEASKKAPPEFWAYDGVHPTHAGFCLLADAWCNAAKHLPGINASGFLET